MNATIMTNQSVQAMMTNFQSHDTTIVVFCICHYHTGSTTSTQWRSTVRVYRVGIMHAVCTKVMQSRGICHITACRISARARLAFTIICNWLTSVGKNTPISEIDAERRNISITMMEAVTTSLHLTDAIFRHIRRCSLGWARFADADWSRSFLSLTGTSSVDSAVCRVIADIEQARTDITA